MSFLDGLSNQFSAFGKKTKDFADSTRLSSMASDEQRTISDIHRECDVTRSVSKMTEIEGRGGKRWDKPKKAGKSRDCRGGKF